MCIHETIQLSQDGERVIVCGDCGREFAKIAEDDAETLVVPVEEGTEVVLLNGGLTTASEGVATKNKKGWFLTKPIYPCARCGFSMSCPKVEGEECHT
jgi:hypothetical protein